MLQSREFASTDSTMNARKLNITEYAKLCDSEIKKKLELLYPGYHISFAGLGYRRDIELPEKGNIIFVLRDGMGYLVDMHIKIM